MYSLIFSSAGMSSVFFSLASKSFDCRPDSSFAEELNTNDCFICFMRRSFVWGHVRAIVIFEMHRCTTIPFRTRMNPRWYLSSRSFKPWDVAWVRNVPWSSAFLMCEPIGGNNFNSSRLRVGIDFRLQIFRFSLKNLDDQSSPNNELLLVVLITNLVQR